MLISDIATVGEIVRMQEITRMPGAPDVVEGVLNLRGKICPVVDLRKCFDVEISDSTDESRIVIVEIDGKDVGVIVDAVTEVLRIPGDRIEPVPGLIAAGSPGFLKGIGSLEKRLITLVHLETALRASGNAAPSHERAASA